MEYKYLDSGWEKQAFFSLAARAAGKGVGKGVDLLARRWGRHLPETATTTERGAVPLAKRVLFGSGRVTPRAGERPIIDAAGSIAPPEGMLQAGKEMLIGRGPIFRPGGIRMDTLRQRYQLGGVLGKGGLVRGSFAPMQASQHALGRAGTALREGRGVGEAWKRLHGHKLDLIGSGLGAGFVAGYPAHSIYQSIRDQTPGGVGGALGESAGYALGAPFGLPGFMVASGVGRYIGGRGHPAPGDTIPTQGAQQQNFVQPPQMPHQPRMPQPPHPPQMPQYTSPQTNYLRHSAQHMQQPQHWDSTTQRQTQHPTVSQHLPTPHPTRGQW